MHTNGIVHGDVHAGNVLLFSEEGEYVAKWADFGMGVVGYDKQYRFLDRKPQGFNQKVIRDISRMASVFIAILKDRKFVRPLTQEETKVLNEFNDMIKKMKQGKIASLVQYYLQYTHILEDELILDEHHFK